MGVLLDVYAHRHCRISDVCVCVCVCTFVCAGVQVLYGDLQKAPQPFCAILARMGETGGGLERDGRRWTGQKRRVGRGKERGAEKGGGGGGGGGGGFYEEKMKRRYYQG